MSRSVEDILLDILKSLLLYIVGILIIVGGLLAFQQRLAFVSASPNTALLWQGVGIAVILYGLYFVFNGVFLRALGYRTGEQKLLGEIIQLKKQNAQMLDLLREAQTKSKSASARPTPVEPDIKSAPAEPAPNSKLAWSHPQKLDWFRTVFCPHFDEWVMAPAERMIDTPEGMPAFIWLTCAIDWMAGFWWGKPIGVADRKTRKIWDEVVYERFIENYFPADKYNAEELYDTLCNGLVDTYTIQGKKYVLANQQPAWHLKTTKGGHLMLNLEDFYADLKDAKNRFFESVTLDPALLDKVIERYEREGFMALIPTDPTPQIAAD